MLPFANVPRPNAGGSAASALQQYDEPLGETAVGNHAAERAEAVKGMITGQQKEPESVGEMVDDCASMSYKNRIIAFAALVAGGLAFMFLSTLMLPFIVFKPHKFAVAYTIGNVLMIASTFLLVGPRRQLQTMFQPPRLAASVGFIVAMVGTLYAALILRVYLLVLALILVQFVSLVWYALSYIPFGRSCASLSRNLRFNQRIM